MKTHISLSTSELVQSVAFYRTLLGAEPTKRRADYALFVTEAPALELALDRKTRAHVDDSTHYGIAVETADEVDSAIARLRLAGIAVSVERDATCCYAKQTKVWASDPDGRRWEVYAVLEETEARDDGSVTCCSDDDPKAADCCAA